MGDPLTADLNKRVVRHPLPAPHLRATTSVRLHLLQCPRLIAAKKILRGDQGPGLGPAGTPCLTLASTGKCGTDILGMIRSHSRRHEASGRLQSGHVLEKAA